MKVLFSKKPIQIGIGSELPEGVFGVMDDIDILSGRAAPGKKNSKKSKLAPPNSAAQSRGNKRIKGKKRKSRKFGPAKRSTKGMQVPSMRIKEESREDELPDLLYENVARIPEELLKKINDKSQMRSRQLSDLLLRRHMPTLLGFDSAKSYVRSAMQDGFNIEVDADEDVLEVFRVLINLDLVYYTLRRTTLSKKFKRLFMEKVIAGSAETAVRKLEVAAKGRDMSKHLKDLQGVIVRGMSERKKQQEQQKQGTAVRAGRKTTTDMNKGKGFASPEDAKRARTVTPAHQDVEMEGLFGVTTQGNRGDLGVVRSRRPK